VKFVAVDMPEANELVVGIMALVAQAEHNDLGAHQGRARRCAGPRYLSKPKGYRIQRAEEARKLGAEANTKAADGFADRLRPARASIGNGELRESEMESEDGAGLGDRSAPGPGFTENPRPWPFGTLEEWLAHRADLERLDEPSVERLKHEADAEIAHIRKVAQS
jgi:hypothetical protein